VNAIVVTYHDITERRRSEESLALQARVLENMDEGVAITDMDGRIHYTNRAFDAMFGYASGELVGALTAVLDYGPGAMSVTGDLLAQVVARGSWSGEIDNQRKDGTPIVTDNRVSQIDVGGMHYIVGLKSDITERKQTQAWIVNTQKLADLGTLAAGVAHELNSPLQVITGVSESLLRRLDQNTLAPDYLRRNLDVLHRNGWRCAEIVRSLHTYARASGGQLAPANLNDLIRDSLLLMEHQLNSWSNITIRTELADALPELLCDRNQITQVLINLLTNARDAMTDGGEITIQTQLEPQTHTIALQVADTGMGIPEEIRTKIFDPFFTTKPIGKGTGLGLSIVAGIIRAYGGDISVDSQLGRGSRFTVQLPVQVPAGVAVSVAAGSGRFDDFGQALLAADVFSPGNDRG
jgi:PAS domain S-box-containing protein